MNEQITTAAELDALPVGSIAARICSDGQGNVAYSLTSEGWCMSTERIDAPRISEYDQVGNHIGPLTVLYRPDTPERTEPTEDQVLTILRTHGIECTGLGEVTCVGCRSAGWMTWGEYRLHLARAVLALLPQRVAPSEEGIAKAIDDHVNSREFGIVRIYDAECAGAAHDVAALCASQPTVAEVRAQALRDAADAYPAITRDMVSRGSVKVWLRARAERGEA